MITALRVRPLNLTLAKPVETASGVMASTPLVLIDVTTTDGDVGSSYVRCYTPTALKPLAELLSNLEPLLQNEAPDAAAIERKLQKHFRLVGVQGLTGIAIAGIDMALWDLAAKRAGKPLVEHLGGTLAPVPAYASLRTMSPQPAAQEAAEHISNGFSAIKVKIGRADLAADLEVVRAVRSAIGERAKLMVDYNQILSVDDAIERARALDNEGLYWIEEPTLAEDFAGHARIAQAAQTPIQLGENWWGPIDVEKSVAAHASDHLMFDVMKLGGVSGWLQAATIAQHANLPVSSHTFPEFSAHLLRLTPTAHFLEYLDHAGPVLREPIRIEGGMATPNTRPGAGIAWNEDVVSRYGV